MIEIFEEINFKRGGKNGMISNVLNLFFVGVAGGTKFESCVFMYILII